MDQYGKALPNLALGTTYSIGGFGIKVSAGSSAYIVGDTILITIGPPPFSGTQLATTAISGVGYPIAQESRLVSPPITIPSTTPGQNILLGFWQWVAGNKAILGDLVRWKFRLPAPQGRGPNCLRIRDLTLDLSAPSQAVGGLILKST